MNLDSVERLQGQAYVNAMEDWAPEFGFFGNINNSFQPSKQAVMGNQTLNQLDL